MVEYIIILAIIAMLVAFIFPHLRENLSEWMDRSIQNMESGNSSMGGSDLFLIFGIAVAVLVGISALVSFLGTKSEDIDYLEEDEEDEFEEIDEPEEIVTSKVIPTLKKVADEELNIYQRLEKLASESDAIDEEMMAKTFMILEYINALNPKMNEFDLETYHVLKRITNTELYHLLRSFTDLNNDNKENQRNLVMQSLSSIENEILSIFARLESQKLHEFTKIATLIRERYQKEA